eukprot:g3697.t1
MSESKGVFPMDVDEKRDISSSATMTSLNKTKTYEKSGNGADDSAGGFDVGGGRGGGRGVEDEDLDETNAMVKAAAKKLEDANNVAKDNLASSVALYEKLYNMNDEDNDQIKKIKGISIVRLGTVFARLKRFDDVRQLTVRARDFLESIPKARTAKIVRNLIVAVSKVPDTLHLQEKLCVDSIAWCKKQKRNFLRQRLETRQASVLLKLKKFDEAMNILRRLQREVKKVDDKQLLLEINLVESRVQFSLKNMPKAKAALTAARTNANSIYVPQGVQAAIDHQAGILQSEERDYKTAYSYFFEAFEGYNTLKQRTDALLNLKYMLLCKIMMDKSHEVATAVGNKGMLIYKGPSVDAMVAVAAAYKKRSLQGLEKVLVDFNDVLSTDEMMKHHLKDLTERLLEANLCRIIEPYSRVQISHVASLIHLPVHRVEAKLSQMILDKKFSGILNQGKGELLIQPKLAENKIFGHGLTVIKNMGDVVDGLFRRAGSINGN